MGLTSVQVALDISVYSPAYIILPLYDVTDLW